VELTRIICYANLNDFNCPQGITDEHMRAFFEQYHKDEEIEIVDVIIDRGPNTNSLSKRDSWKEVLRQCEEKDIHMISVPSFSMISCNLSGIIYTIREMKQQYNVDFYFAYENVCTSNPNSEMALQIQCIIVSEQDSLKAKANKMRLKFLDATGIQGEPSAISLLVECDLYHAGQKLAEDYGLNLEDLVHEFIRFATDPCNTQAFEQYIMGIAPGQA